MVGIGIHDSHSGSQLKLRWTTSAPQPMTMCYQYQVYQHFSFSFINRCSTTRGGVITIKLYCNFILFLPKIKSQLKNRLQLWLPELFLVLRSSLFRRSIENCSIRRHSIEISVHDIGSTTFDL